MEQQRLLENVSAELSRPPHLLEKDIWVVRSLEVMFGADIGNDLIFKGGTSLSKVYKVIDRFSEDIDVTVDIRRLLPEETARPGFPPGRKAARRLRDQIEKIKLPAMIDFEILPEFEKNLPANTKLKRQNTDLFVDYSDLQHSSRATFGYVEPVVKIEFGGASSGEPNHQAEIASDASLSNAARNIYLPEAMVRVMDIERTFWEKATLAHVACVKGKNNWERYARHWYDLAQIYESEYWGCCLNDIETARLVAQVKSSFYHENGIDFNLAIDGNIQIVPGGAQLDALKNDYNKMIAEGMFGEDPEPFEELIAKCDEIAVALNGRISV